MNPPDGTDWDLHATQFGETPIDDDARQHLTPEYAHIVTKDELNLAESSNIALAFEWLEDHPFAMPTELLDQYTLRDLHRRMFEHVWSWAGRLRTRETNMGVDPSQIVHDWEVLLRNTQAQIEHSSYPLPEIGVRLHRGMLAIHCFPNGNGRHARMVANELARMLGLGETFYTWGGRNPAANREAARRKYLQALRIADADDEYGPLVDIATS